MTQVNKHHYTQQDIETAAINIARQIQKDNWKPDYIVGLTRGGLIPAVMLSHYMGVRMETLNVQLRDGDADSCEMNLWMAEDAFGYVSGGDTVEERKAIVHGENAKNILIVDDINDEGNTLQWVKDDWKSGCLPNNERWDQVWGHNVRTAVLTENLASSVKTDYNHFEINKAEDDTWLVYPWEDWWAR